MIVFNRKLVLIFWLVFTVILGGCKLFNGDKWDVQTTVVQKKTLNSTLSSVNVANDQITIIGSGFANVTTVQLQGNGANATLNINSKSDSQIIATASSALSLLANGAFNLIIGTVEAQVTYPITFTLQNGAVTAANLAQMGASSGQVLKWNGSVWAPASLAASQVYLGNWDATTFSPDITSLGTFQNGDYFIVSVAGTYTSSVLVTSPTTFAVGDWVMFNGSKWDKIDNTSNLVTSFNTRHGEVTLVDTDYVLLKNTTTHKLTGSSINDLADINLTIAPTDGQVLKWNSATSKWTAASDLTTGGVGSVATTELADGAVTYTKMTLNDGDIPLPKVNGLVTALAGKEPTITAGTTTKYFRGDKTFVTLDTSAVPENTNLYFTNARALGLLLAGVDTTLVTAITASDSVLLAFGKTQGQLNNKLNTASFVDWSAVGIQTIDPTRLSLGIGNPSLAVVTNGSGAITASSVTATELGYVSGVTSSIQTQLNNIGNGTNANQWISDGSGNVYRSTGKVGIGTTSPGSALEIKGTGGLRLEGATSGYVGLQAPATAGSVTYTLPSGGLPAVAGYVLSSDTSGVLSWVAQPTSAVTSVNTQTGAVVLNSDNIAEGSTNIYHTSARTLSTAITAPTLTNSAITTNDTIQVAFGKVQAQINNLLSTLLAGLSTATSAVITSGDSILSAMGKLQAQISAHTTSIAGKANTTDLTQTITAAAVTGLTTPLADSDAARKKYVDDLINGNGIWAKNGSSINFATGGVAIGSTTVPVAKLEVTGAAISKLNVITSGAVVDLSLSNTFVLRDPQGSVITLSNLVPGGAYTIIVTDTLNPRTYTFSGCNNSYFSPANTLTEFRSTYTILVGDDPTSSGTPDCYIAWTTGFN
jgi:hypothetical protein